MATWLDDLAGLLSPGQVLTGPAAETAYRHDAYTVDQFRPEAVVLPVSTEEVASVVRLCNFHGVPFTARGAGTGLSGGAMPALGGVVVSTKRMTAILEADWGGLAMKAQSGCVNTKLSRAAAPYGLHFAPDPSSQTVSTLGGNIAENSGGPHTLKYGVTAQHILGVTLVQAHGEVTELGGRVAGMPGYDLLSLVVGSEGTLGIVTEAWVRLTPVPSHILTALVNFATPRDASNAVAAIIQAGVLPAALELMDRQIMDAVSAAFGITYPPDSGTLLLVECDGEREAAEAEMRQVEDVCGVNGSISAEVTSDPARRAFLWTTRKKGVGAMGRLAPTLVTHDGVIPPSKLPEMLDEVYAVAKECGLNVANLFHAGDGNLHPVFYFDERQPGKIEAVVEAGERIIRRCLELGGSVTGEHGIGVEKAGLLAQMFDLPSMALQADARRIFHENPLCNPCKVVPDAKGCVEHQRRWRGAAT